jgi:23S rRNA pseudouridine2605 synthase
MPVERLQRSLARAGLGSRRACEDLIRAGRVKVGGRVAALGDRVDPTSDVVTVSGVRVAVNPESRYLALHKPVGVTTTLSDRHAGADIRAFLPEGPRLVPVGRLDRDSEGLILLTNDGELANRLTHPSYGVEKEYLAEVEGKPSERQLIRLRKGVKLEDGPARALAARVAGVSGGRGAVRLVMGEGRKREVRRLLAAVGLPVRRLIRVRVGPVKLGSLKAGHVRELSPEELRRLVRAAGM